MGPPKWGPSLSATAWGLIGGAIALLLVVILVLILCFFCSATADAAERMRGRIASWMPCNKQRELHPKKNDDVQWQHHDSIDLNGGWTSPALHQLEESETQDQAPQRIYFGQQDLNDMSAYTHQSFAER